MMHDKIFFDSKDQIGAKRTPIKGTSKSKFDGGGSVSGDLNVGDTGYLKRNKSLLVTITKIAPKRVYYTQGSDPKIKSLYTENFLKSFNRSTVKEIAPKFDKTVFPSTERITWFEEYKVGDVVGMRPDIAEFTGVDFGTDKNILAIIKKTTPSSVKRKENPKGIVYELQQVYGGRMFTLEPKDIFYQDKEKRFQLITAPVEKQPKEEKTAEEKLKNYRIKTENEFENEYGDRWKQRTAWNRDGEMDYLFGKRLTEVVNPLNYEEVLDKIENNYFFDVVDSTQRTWTISDKMYGWDPISEYFDEPKAQEDESEFDWRKAFNLYIEKNFTKPKVEMANPFTHTEAVVLASNAYEKSISKLTEPSFARITYTIDDVDNVRKYLALNLNSEPIIEALKDEKKDVKENVEKIVANYDLISDKYIEEVLKDGKGQLINVELFEYLDAKKLLGSENSEFIKKIDEKIEQLSTEFSSEVFFSPKGYYETYFLMNSSTIEDLKVLNKSIPYFTRTHAFQKWFIGSVVVIDGNIPKIVYHGSKNEGFSNFKFDLFPGIYFAEKKSYSEWFARLGPNDTLFSCYLKIKNPIDLTIFGLNKVKYEEFVGYIELKYKYRLQENKALKAYSDTQNGMWAWQYLRGGIDWLKQIIKDGVFDGLKFYENNPDDNTEGKENQTIAWMVFKPNQIKAATGNLIYSNYSEDIRFNKGGAL